MSTAPRTLIHLHVSPWSERARWALDHHGLPYSKVPHVPILGERRLRRIVGGAAPRATVPVLVEGELVLRDSWDIARHADRIGAGTKLIPADREAAVRAWATRADEAMAAGRGLVLDAMIASPAALDEGAPPPVPAALRPLLRPVARRLLRAMSRKYGLPRAESTPRLAMVRDALDALRRALAGNATYVLGAFSYADIVMATLLQAVTPVADRHLRLGPATRAAWTNAALAAEYADLVGWRDRLYDAHRRPHSRPTR